MNDVDDAVTCNRYEYLTSSSKFDVECLGILIARVGPVLVLLSVFTSMLRIFYSYQVPGTYQVERAHKEYGGPYIYRNMPYLQNVHYFVSSK